MAAMVRRFSWSVIGRGVTVNTLETSKAAANLSEFRAALMRTRATFVVRLCLRSSYLTNLSRSLAFQNLPVEVRGTASMNSTRSGICHLANTVLK